MKDNDPLAPAPAERGSATPAPLASELPRRRGRGWQAFAFVTAALAIKIAVLAALGRPLGCGCDQLWALPGNVGLNSQTVLDPYSLQHLIFGTVLVKLVRWQRPDWPLWTLMAAVIVSSTIWEVVENLPFSIDLFGYASVDPLAYHGDSIVNSLSDTVLAVLGAALGLPLAGWVIAVIAVAVEILLSVAIADGFLITIWRAFRG